MTSETPDNDKPASGASEELTDATKKMAQAAQRAAREGFDKARSRAESLIHDQVAGGSAVKGIPLPFIFMAIAAFALIVVGGGAFFVHSASKKAAASIKRKSKRALRRSGAREYVKLGDVTVHAMPKSAIYHDVKITMDDEVTKIDTITISNYKMKDDVLRSVKINLSGIRGSLFDFSDGSSQSSDILDFPSLPDSGTLRTLSAPMTALNYGKAVGDIGIIYLYNEKKNLLNLEFTLTIRGINEYTIKFVLGEVEEDTLSDIADVIQKGGDVIQAILQDVLSADSLTPSAILYVGRLLKIVNDLIDIELVSFEVGSHDLGIFDRLSYMMAYDSSGFDKTKVSISDVMEKNDGFEDFKDSMDEISPDLPQIFLKAMRPGGSFIMRSHFSSPIPIVEKHRGDYVLSSDLQDIKSLLEDGDIKFSN